MDQRFLLLTSMDDQWAWTKTTEPRRQLKLNLSRSRHSSPQSAVEIRFRHKHEKWTKFSDGSTIFDEIISPCSHYLLQIPNSIDLEPYLSSALSRLIVIGLLHPSEINRVAEDLAAEHDGELGIFMVVAIEVEEESEQGDLGEIREMINQESALSEEEGDVEDDLGVCSMCWNDMFVDNAPVGKLLSCRYFFHDSCILDWFSGHDSCPLCESEIAVVCTSNPR